MLCESVEELETNLAAHKHDVLVEVEVNQESDLSLGIDTVCKDDVLDLAEVLHNVVGIALVSRVGLRIIIMG